MNQALRGMINSQPPTTKVVANKMRRDALMATFCVRNEIDKIRDAFENEDKHVGPQMILESCEQAAPGVVFPGAGFLFDYYFLVYGGQRDRKSLGQADHKQRGILHALKQHIIKKLQVKFFFWVLASLRRHSQRACTATLFRITLLTDFRGLSSKHSFVVCPLA